MTPLRIIQGKRKNSKEQENAELKRKLALTEKKLDIAMIALSEGPKMYAHTCAKAIRDINNIKL